MLDLSVAALKVTKPLKNVSVAETQVATFECEVSHFNVPSTWLKDGVEIEMSEKFRIVVQGKLHQLKIMNTSRDDAAEYTFICGNDRVSATLTVNREFTSHRAHRHHDSAVYFPGVHSIKHYIITEMRILPTEEF